MHIDLSRGNALRAILSGILLLVAIPGCDQGTDVYPGQDIQQALDRAAKNSFRRIRVHEGVYRPSRRAQAMIWFDAQHDGIVLEAVGNVVLTAANADLASLNESSFPAVVNHVIYFGDGISRKTVLRGFRITGANHFVTREEQGVAMSSSEKDEPRLRRGLFYYNDGGAIKIFGRSYPTIENVEIADNFASPCAGGISIEHQGFMDDTVRLRDSKFFDNRSQVTGSAIDLLPGSSAELENCLFVGNVSNTGVDYISPPGYGYNGRHGSGALTVMKGSRVKVIRCTFTGNWNGVDDKGENNVYQWSIFWNNTLVGGISPKDRYELDILEAAGVTECYFGGPGLFDLRQTVNRAANVFDAPDPQFDERFHPQISAYDGIGYREVN